MTSRVFGALIGWLLLFGVAQAQVEEIKAPITATATPVLGLPGTVVTLRGETPPAQPGAKVSLVITITPTPQSAGGAKAEPLKREAVVDAKGHWSLTLKDTATIGRYSVDVLGPDKKGHAKTQFEIVGNAAYEEGAHAQIKAMHKSVDATLTALTERTQELIKGLPDGSEKEETTRRFEVIKRNLDRIRQTLPNPLPGPPLPPDMPPKSRIIIISPIIETTRAITMESDRVRIALEASRPAAAVCQRLDTAMEALNFTSSFTNFMAKNTEVLINHLTDKVSPALIEWAPKSKEGEKFIQAETVKVVVATMRKGQNLVNSVPGLALDLMNYVAKDYYKKVCTRFEGPFTGTLKIEFYTDSSNRDMYWSYTTKVGGMMSLSQPKSFDGKSGSVMVGRVDGSGMGYHVTEDTLKINPELRSVLIYHRAISPPEEIPLPPMEMGALFNTLTHPLGFQSILRAERKGDEVIVNFDDAALRDMSPNFNRTLVIHVFNAGIMPVLNYQMLPMQGGHYILSRGMRKNAVLHLTTKGNEQHLRNTFTRTEDLGDIRLRWDVEVDLCSPVCTTTTIDRVKAWWAAGQAKVKK